LLARKKEVRRDAVIYFLLLIESYWFNSLRSDNPKVYLFRCLLIVSMLCVREDKKEFGSTDLYMKKSLTPSLRGLSESATLAVNRRSAELEKQGREIFRFGLGQSPFPVPALVVNELKERASEKDYLAVDGLYELREAVASYYERRWQIESTPERIMIAPGSKELIFILQLVYSGDILIPTPAWVSYAPQAQIVGRHVSFIETKAENRFLLHAAELDAFCRHEPDMPRLLILNYPSNPTGQTYSSRELQELAEVARRYGVIVLSDEIYGETHFHNDHDTLARYYREGTIVSSGLSKWCGAGGWRLGVFNFPEELLWLQQAMCVVASETYTSTSAPIQWAAVKAFEGGPEIDAYLTSSRRVLGILSRYICTELSSSPVKFHEPAGAFYLFPSFEEYRERLAKKGIYGSKAFMDRLLDETGIAALPGVEFGRAPEELTARFSFVPFDGRVAQEQVREGDSDEEMLKRLLDCCPKIQKFPRLLLDWLES
jgi:aspartate aminotransferase